MYDGGDCVMGTKAQKNADYIKQETVTGTVPVLTNER